MAKILVIEDETDVRDSIVDILNAEDFIVDSAANGQEGLSLIEEFHPDLVLCDIMMPVLDGYGVLEHLRRQEATKTLPFIFLTAKADKSDMRTGMNLGANDYLTKPFTHDDLLGMIHARLGVKQALEEKTNEQLETLRNSISTALPRELSGPLQEVMRLSAALEEEAETLNPVEVASYAKAILHNAHQVALLNQNLLLVAKLQAIDIDSPVAKTFRQQTMADAHGLIQHIATDFAASYLRDNDLQIQLEPCNLQMAETTLKKICEELIDNSFKFSWEGKPVKVMGSHQEDYYTLYIMDYGQGMTPEQIAHIGAYQQFSTGIEASGGVGLGLTIAQRLVMLHSGEMLIESLPGQQTVVRLMLPLAP
jgi:two-component system sensor histidine kinase/response regulator